MSYSAIVAPVPSVVPHPNSDNGLKLVKIAGSQVITSVDYQVGDLAVFFPVGGRISDEYLFNNSEYRFSASLGSTVRPNKILGKSGLFDENGRVRSIRLRGEPSEGYIAPLSSFAYTGFDFSGCDGGWLFTELGTYAICERYVSPTQQRQLDRAATANKTPGIRKKLVEAPTFLEHFDTKNFKYTYQHIPEDALILVTEKLHGTSGRTGNVLVRRELALSAFERTCARARAFFEYLPQGLVKAVQEAWLLPSVASAKYETISGSRRVAFLNEIKDGYHVGTGFREAIHQSLEGRLHKGETLYYEIVGYQAPNSPLFHHKMKKDGVGTALLKQFKAHLQSNNMEYSYGCNRELGEHRIFIYRITYTNKDGHQIDLSYPQRVARCNILGIPHVPMVYYGFLRNFLQVQGPDLLANMNALADAPSSLSDAHISEGVVVEITHPEMMTTLKNKAFNFLYLEDLIKEDDSFVDIEEVS